MHMWREFLQQALWWDVELLPHVTSEQSATSSSSSLYILSLDAMLHKEARNNYSNSSAGLRNKKMKYAFAFIKAANKVWCGIQPKF